MSAVLHPESLPQPKIGPGQLALAAIVYLLSELRREFSQFKGEF